MRHLTLPNGLVSISSDLFRGCTNLENIAFPNGLKQIGSSAFEGCTSLAKITLPSSLKEIDGSAFDKCNNLMTVNVLGATPPKISSNSFSKTTFREAAVHIRKGTLGNFQINKQWAKFLDLIER